VKLHLKLHSRGPRSFRVSQGGHHSEKVENHCSNATHLNRRAAFKLIFDKFYIHAPTPSLWCTKYSYFELSH